MSSLTDANWKAMYKKLKNYKRQNGHCNVRYTFERDPPLGFWVHNQRRAGKNGTLLDFRYHVTWRCTDSVNRRAKLDKIGFQWHVHTPRNHQGVAIQRKRKREYCLVIHWLIRNAERGWDDIQDFSSNEDHPESCGQGRRNRPMMRSHARPQTASTTESDEDHENKCLEVDLDEGEMARKLSLFFCNGCQKTHSIEHRWSNMLLVVLTIADPNIQRRHPAQPNLMILFPMPITFWILLKDHTWLRNPHIGLPMEDKW
jgi:hypothetical protein